MLLLLLLLLLLDTHSYVAVGLVGQFFQSHCGLTRTHTGLPSITLRIARARFLPAKWIPLYTPKQQCQSMEHNFNDNTHNISIMSDSTSPPLTEHNVTEPLMAERILELIRRCCGAAMASETVLATCHCTDVSVSMYIQRSRTTDAGVSSSVPTQSGSQ